jgi:hypothetical protein
MDAQTRSDYEKLRGSGYSRHLSGLAIALIGTIPIAASIALGFTPPGWLIFAVLCAALIASVICFTIGQIYLWRGIRLLLRSRRHRAN